MNALSELSTMPLTKSQQQDFAEQAINELLSGTVDPVLTDMKLKAVEEVIKRIREDCRVRSQLIEEAERHGKTFTMHSVKVEIKSRTTRDYTGCGDEVYLQLQRDAETLKIQMKAREMMLSGGVNPETGETYAPPKTSTTVYLAYSF